MKPFQGPPMSVGGASEIIAQSAVQVAHTGTIAEVVLASFVIPAGALGPNDQLEIDTLWTNNNSAGAKNQRVRFGTTNYLALAPTTNVTHQYKVFVSNRGVPNSQIGFGNTGVSYNSTGAGAIASAIDTTQDVTVQILGQLATDTDIIRLERFSARINRIG